MVGQYPTTTNCLVIVLGVLFFTATVAKSVHPDCQRASTTVRPIDGFCNNLYNPTWGTPGTALRRKSAARYLDGERAAIPGPNERTVSQQLFATEHQANDLELGVHERLLGLYPEPRGLNMIAVIFGQFISHDIAHTPIPFTSNVSLNFAIPIENCTLGNNLLRDELCTFHTPFGNSTTIFTRPSDGIFVDGVFQPTNHVTPYLDLSPVYGSTTSVSSALRSFQNGKLIEGPGRLLPESRNLSTPNECGVFRPGVSAAGDERADENFLITAIQILFLREHNRLAEELVNKGWINDEAIFQEARKKNIAQYQHIIYDEWTPAFIGIANANQIGDYKKYDDAIHAGVWNEFSTVGFRLHTMVNLPLLILEDDCSMVYGVLKNFTSPAKTEERQTCEAIRFKEIGPDSVLRGSFLQAAQNFDTKVTDRLRNIRLTAPGSADVPAANVFRGRHHGISDFNTVRKSFGLQDFYATSIVDCNPSVLEDSISCFAQITSNASLAQQLKSIYKKVNKVDAFVGLVAEKKAPGSSLGITATNLLIQQLGALRDGDRFWYERKDNGRLFHNKEISDIKTVTFASLLRANFPNLVVPNQTFFVPTSASCLFN